MNFLKNYMISVSEFMTQARISEMGALESSYCVFILEYKHIISALKNKLIHYLGCDCKQEKFDVTSCSMGKKTNKKMLLNLVVFSN